MNETLAYESCAPATRGPIAVSPPQRRLNLYLWLLLTATNVVDVLATARAFEIGIGELNPIVAMLYTQFGIGSVVVFKAVFLGLLCFMIPYIRTWTRALLMLACCIYCVLTAAHVWYLMPLL